MLENLLEKYLKWLRNFTAQFLQQNYLLSFTAIYLEEYFQSERVPRGICRLFPNTDKIIPSFFTQGSPNPRSFISYQVSQLIIHRANLILTSRCKFSAPRVNSTSLSKQFRQTIDISFFRSSSTFLSKNRSEHFLP